MSNLNDETRAVSSADLEGGARAAEAPDDFRLPEGVLLALRPMGHHMVTEGVVKPFDAIEVYAIEVEDNGDYTDLGLRDCGWQFVMRELDKCTQETPWVIGTVEKKSRAYFLRPPFPEQEKAGLEAIASLIADRQREEEAATDEPF